MKELRQEILNDVSKVTKFTVDILLSHDQSFTENNSSSLRWSSLDVCPSRSHHVSSRRHTEAWTLLHLWSTPPGDSRSKSWSQLFPLLSRPLSFPHMWRLFPTSKDPNASLTFPSTLTCVLLQNPSSEHRFNSNCWISRLLSCWPERWLMSEDNVFVVGVSTELRKTYFTHNHGFTWLVRNGGLSQLGSYCCEEAPWPWQLLWMKTFNEELTVSDI